MSMSVSERVAELIQWKNGDPLKGIYSSTAALWLEMPHCHEGGGIGCVFYEGVLPKNLRQIFALDKKSYHLTIALEVEGDGKNQSWLMAKINDMEFLFTVRCETLNDKLKRTLVMTGDVGSDPSLVKAGSVEHKTYVELIDLASYAKKNGENQLICNSCSLRNT